MAGFLSSGSGISVMLEVFDECVRVMIGFVIDIQSVDNFNIWITRNYHKTNPSLALKTRKNKQI